MYNLIYSKKMNQDYTGPAFQCTYEFEVNKPDQLGTQKTAQDTLNALVQQLEAEGSQVLEYSLWEDKSPTWETKYFAKLVASGYAQTEEVSSRISGPQLIPIIVVIVAALAVVFAIVVLLTVKEVINLPDYVIKPISNAIIWASVAIVALSVVGGTLILKRKTT